MDYAMQIIEKLNIPQLIATGVIIWFFYQRLDKKIEKLSDKIDDVDKRLCRLEGAFSAKDCCMIKDERRLPKAE